MSTQPNQERSLLAFFSPKEMEKMARREYQNPALQKTKGDRPQWYIRVRVRVVTPTGIKRKQTREYLGLVKTGKSGTGLTVREAEREREQKLNQINGQIFSIPSHCRFVEFVNLYYEKQLPKLREGTQAKYRLHLTNHLLPAFGAQRLCDIGRPVIQDFLDLKGNAGLSWWTRNDLRNILSAVFTFAAERNFWQMPNPVEKTTCGPKKVKRQKKILTLEQLQALISAVPPKIGLLLRLVDSTGMRISEALGLKWRYVHLDTGLIEIEERQYRGDQGEPKTDGSHRVLPLADLLPEIEELWREQGKPSGDVFVFQNECGNPMSYENLRGRILKPAAKKLGIDFEGFGFHSFRRGFVTGVQEDGASAIEAQKLAGHSKPDMTSEYTIMQRKRQEEIVRARQKRLSLDLTP